MAKAKTFFEQVPVEFARQIAARDGGVEHSAHVLCGICGTPVELEHCKTNEFGQAVHGKCYASRIAGGVASTTVRSAPFKVRQRARAI